VEQAKEASLESSIVVKGVAKSEPRAPGGYEIHADHFEAFHITKDWPWDEKSMVLSSWKKQAFVDKKQKTECHFTHQTHH